MTGVLEIAREGRLLRLRLRRPEKRNALNRALCAELLAAFHEADRDPGVGAILLEAEGPAFCAGLDLDEILSPEAFDDVLLHDRLFNIAEDISIPIVAAVQGQALAGGMALVANAHIAVAAQGSTFGMTEVRLGLFPYVPFRAIEAAIGRRRALDLCLTGRVFTAPEALHWGLVHHVAPAFEYDDLARNIAESLAAGGSDAIRGGLNFARRPNNRELAVRERQEALKSADLHEGVSAIRARREPLWPSNRTL